MLRVLCPTVLEIHSMSKKAWPTLHSKLLTVQNGARLLGHTVVHKQITGKMHVSIAFTLFQLTVIDGAKVHISPALDDPVLQYSLLVSDYSIYR